MLSALQRSPLRGDKLADPFIRETHHHIQFSPAERLTFRGSLQLHQTSTSGHDDVHVGSTRRILDVVEVEHRHALINTNRYGGDKIARWRPADRTLVQKKRDRVLDCDERARDAGRARAAVGLY